MAAIGSRRVVFSSSGLRGSRIATNKIVLPGEAGRLQTGNFVDVERLMYRQTKCHARQNLIVSTNLAYKHKSIHRCTIEVAPSTNAGIMKFSCTRVTESTYYQAQKERLFRYLPATCNSN